MSLSSSVKSAATRYLSRYPKIAFVHVPKCGGVSVYEAVYNAIYPAVLKTTPFTKAIDLRGSKKAEELIGLDMMIARQASLIGFLNNEKSTFVTGHCYAHPKVVAEFSANWSFITVLRNPIERFISEYIYNTHKKSNWHVNDTSINEYVDSYKAMRSGIGLCRYFSGLSIDQINETETTKLNEIIQANLDNFAIVGKLEDMKSFSSQFYEKFDKKLNMKQSNVSPQSDLAEKIRQDAALMEKITSLCEKDLLVYNTRFSKGAS